MEPDQALREFATRHPAAQRLAELACLAVRVEPHFLRALRQRFLRDSHPGAELELWHGPLAAGPGADGFTFEPEVLQALRRRLGDEPIEIKTAVLALTLHSHRHHPELARLEAELNALAVIDPDVDNAAIKAVLEPALDQLRAGGEAALRVARWLLHAAPRLHPRVLRVGATWLALLQASAQLGGRRLLEQAPPADIDLAGFAWTQPLPPVGTRTVGVLLANGWLQFRSPLLAGARITVPAIAPSMVTVASDGGDRWSVEAAPGVSLDVNGAAALTVLTLTGDRFRLEATRRLRAGEGMVIGRSAPLLMRVWARTAQTISYEFTDRDGPDGPDASERRGTFVRAEVGRAALLRELVASASNDGASGAQIRRTLYHLLIPKEIEYLLGGNSETGLDVDRFTADLPWELLDTERVEVGGLTRPWAVRSKLLRMARPTPTQAPTQAHTSPHTQPPTNEPAAVTKEDRALVIGEPLCDASMYPPLPGARAEARAVVAQLGAGAGRLAADHVRALVGTDCDADSVIHALFEHPYRIVHIAGHGGFDASEGDARACGVVLSRQGTRLGANEVRAMRAVPDLVFMNCCHQPAPDAALAVRAYDRAAFAATVAEALIQVGVRCVIVAGWAVEAEPAAQFAGTFYEALLGGERFVDAVAAAREAAWRLRPEGNTWGAYQCYGDADWRWHRDTGSDASDAGPGGEMASPMELAQTLEDLANRAQWARASDRPRLGRRVQALEQRYGPVWGAMGAVAQAFGAAFGAAADADRAVFWYRAAMGADDGSMTFKAVEQLAHHLTCRGAGQDGAAGQHDIAAAIDHLHKLVAIQPTAERENLLGRAYKSRAMSEARGARAAASTDALERTIKHFGAALSLAGTTRPAWAFEAGKTLLGAELRLALMHKRRPTLAPGRIEAMRDLMGPESADHDLDLATTINPFELRWLEGVATGTLAHVAPDLVASLSELAAGASAAPLWAPALAEARFILEPYLMLADAAERAAVKEVLSCLAGLAAK